MVVLSDAAVATVAYVVLTTDQIGHLADAIAIGRRTLAIAKQGIWIAMGASGAFISPAAFGCIQPTLGAVAVLQEVLDVAVILNALRR